MKQEWIRWTAAAAFGLALIATGCGDKGESGTRPPPAGLTPASPPETTGPEGNLPPSVGSEQGPSGTNNEPSPEREQKAQRR